MSPSPPKMEFRTSKWRDHLPQGRWARYLILATTIPLAFVIAEMIVYIMMATAPTAKKESSQARMPMIIQQQDGSSNMSPEVVAKKTELKHLWDFDASLSFFFCPHDFPVSLSNSFLP